MPITASIKQLFTRIAAQPAQMTTAMQAPEQAGNRLSADVIPLQTKAVKAPQGSNPDQTFTPPAELPEEAPLNAGEAFETRQASRSPFRGLLDDPEIRKYLDQNFFGFGRHNGARYQTQQALATGREALISKFTNVLANLIQRHLAKQHEMERKQQAVRALSPELATRLSLSMQQNAQVIKTLEDQIVAASSGEGWVAVALSEYESGFTRGVYDSVEFDLLDA